MNKTIGLIVATDTEFNTIFLKRNFSYKTLEEVPFLIKEISINNKTILVINSGVGEIYSTMATQYLLSKYHVDCVLNYGVVGSLSDNLSLNCVVFVEKIFDYQFDLTLIDKVPLGYHNEFNSIYIPIKSEIFTKIKNSFTHIPSVTCASGNKFVADSKEKENLQKSYQCDICEMESVGIALTCYKNNVPVIFVKGVSDTKHGGAEEYNKMVSTSSAVAFDVLLKVLNLF